MADERQPDYEAACLFANDSMSDNENYEHLLIDHGYRQGLAARLTPEELRAIGDACTLLTGMVTGIEGLPRDEMMARRALPVLKAIAGKGAP